MSAVWVPFIKGLREGVCGDAGPRRPTRDMNWLHIGRLKIVTSIAIAAYFLGPDLYRKLR